MSRNRFSDLIFCLGALICWFSFLGTANASSCITCHTDEDRLLQYLTDKKVPKSALQSGAG